MLTKLTLTIDEEIIVRAKKYAQKKHRSVSKIVEEYLKNVSSLDERELTSSVPSGKLTTELVGMFKDDFPQSEYKDILFQALMEKYS